MKMLRIAAQCQPVVRRADGSVTLKFVSAEEVETELFAEIDSYRQVNGHLLFAPDKPKMSDVPDGNSKGDDEPSQSYQLRMALFALHSKQGGSKEDFEVFYTRSMERIRQQIIDRMN